MQDRRGFNTIFKNRGLLHNFATSPIDVGIWVSQKVKMASSRLLQITRNGKYNLISSNIFE